MGRRFLRAALMVVLLSPVLGMLGMVAVGRALRPDPPRAGLVQGVLLDVQASPVGVESVAFRDVRGQVWAFRGDPEIVTNPDEPKSPDELLQHAARGDSMIVIYQEGPDGPRAMRIRDAP